MVCLTQNPNFLDASCWSVEVVKGAHGVRFASFFSIFSRQKSICFSKESSLVWDFDFFCVISPFPKSLKNASTAVCSLNDAHLPEILCKDTRSFCF